MKFIAKQTLSVQNWDDWKQGKGINFAPLPSYITDKSRVRDASSLMPKFSSSEFNEFKSLMDKEQLECRTNTMSDDLGTWGKCQIYHPYCECVFETRFQRIMTAMKKRKKRTRTLCYLCNPSSTIHPQNHGKYSATSFKERCNKKDSIGIIYAARIEVGVQRWLKIGVYSGFNPQKRMDDINEETNGRVRGRILWLYKSSSPKQAHYLEVHLKHFLLKPFLVKLKMKFGGSQTEIFEFKKAVQLMQTQ